MKFDEMFTEGADGSEQHICAFVLTFQLNTCVESVVIKAAKTRYNRNEIELIELSIINKVILDCGKRKFAQGKCLPR